MYHNKYFLMCKNLQYFFMRQKKLKNGHFWRPLHKSELNFYALAIDIQHFYKFTISTSSNLQEPCEISKRSID